jgi:hypothetical protein
MPRKPRKSVQAIGPRFDASNGLTGIPQPIHCPATTDGEGGNDEYDELERIQVEHFLNTLAQIALAVAARQGCQHVQ